jgi:hypothetical protein
LFGGQRKTAEMLKLSTKVRLRTVLRRPFNGLYSPVFCLVYKG